MRREWEKEEEEEEEEQEEEERGVYEMKKGKAMNREKEGTDKTEGKKAEGR